MEKEALIQMARLSERVYGIGGPIQIADLFPNAIRHRTFDQRDYYVRFVWIEEADRYVVCFRGSIHQGRNGLTSRSWRLNLKAQMRGIRFGINSHLHLGYLDQATQAYRLVKSQLLGKPVVVCGHSQGGGLALVFATQLHRFNRSADIEVLTFGQPRVGNLAYCRYLDMHELWPVNRIVNTGDGVSKLPPTRSGYSHCERPFYLSHTGALNPNQHFKFSLFGTLRSHPMEQYLARLRVT